MKRNLRITLHFILATIFIVTALIGYLPEPECLIEITFISNFLIGCIFLVSGIRIAKGGKDFPNIVYSTGLVTIVFVFLICMGSLSGAYQMNFSGAYFFLHVINPILMVVFYFVFVNEKKYGKIKNIFFTPTFIIVYMFFDYIIGTAIKQYVYGFFQPGELSIWMAFIVGLVMYVMLIIIGFIAYGSNRLFRRNESI